MICGLCEDISELGSGTFEAVLKAKDTGSAESGGYELCLGICAL